MQDMTTGSPLKLIIRFTIPLLIGNIFQQLYSLVDAIIVGRALGMNALGSIGAVGSLVFFVQGFALGVASGFSLILAQRFGTKNDERIRSSFATSLWIALIVVVILTILSIVFANQLLAFMNIPETLFADSKEYFVTTMCGLVGLMLFNLLVNVLRSMGNARQLLLFMVMSQVLNIVFDVLFILVFPLGVIGVALATIVSQVIVGLICQNYLFKKVPLLRLNKGDLRMDKRDMRLHLKISLPIGLQSSIIAVGSIVLQLKLNGLGAAAVEGHSIGGRLESMVTMPLVSFGVATATYAAQNYGAGQMDRIWKGVRASSLVSVTYSAVVGGLLFFFGDELAVTLFGSDNAESIVYVERYFKMTTLMYVVLSLLYIVRYTLQGMGKSVAPTIAGLMEMSMRALVPLFFANVFGFEAVAISHPLAWTSALMVVGVTAWLIKKDDQTSRLKRFITS